ncbi:MAG: hypothetical protein ABF665_11185 [Gluconacetobacter sp.]
MSGPTVAEHARLIRLEAELLKVRGVVAKVIRDGYEECRRESLEAQLGALLVVLTEMEESGDVCSDNANAVAQAIAAGRRGELAGARA